MNEAGGGQPEQQLNLPPAEAGAESVAIPEQQDRPASEGAAGKQATPAAAQPLPVIPDVPSPLPAAPARDDSQMAVSSPKTAKLPAADGNLIEKQWVTKAKEIVAETKSDPYKQKNEISKAKADYIQKRFKKTIRTDDTVTA